MDLYTRALMFAVKAHGDQKRRFTHEPYVVHPIAVSMIVRGALERDYNSQVVEEVMAAALMHDVLEDTDVTEAEMQEKFGPTVTDLVKEVTDVLQLGNREVRTAANREHIAKASFFGKTIKLADLMDNTKSIVEHDKKFAKVYLGEKALALEVLKDGPPLLYAMTRESLHQAINTLAGAS
jgi:(p)ppGpp synthase/HD superfamily hydrolase